MKLSEVCKNLIKKWNKERNGYSGYIPSYQAGFNAGLQHCASELEKNLPKPLVHTFLRVGKNPRLYKVEDEHRYYYESNPHDFILLGTNLMSDQILGIMYKEVKPAHYHDYFPIRKTATGKAIEVKDPKPVIKSGLFSW